MNMTSTLVKEYLTHGKTLSKFSGGCRILERWGGGATQKGSSFGPNVKKPTSCAEKKMKGQSPLTELH